VELQVQTVLVEGLTAIIAQATYPAVASTASAGQVTAIVIPVIVNQTLVHAQAIRLVVVISVLMILVEELIGLFVQLGSAALSMDGMLQCYSPIPEKFR
jgi:hypothetical protein